MIEFVAATALMILVVGSLSVAMLRKDRRVRAAGRRAELEN